MRDGPQRNDTFVVQTVLQPMPPRVLVPIRIGDDATFSFVLDTGAPLTSMSPTLYEKLAMTGHMTRIARNRYVLRPVHIADYDIGCLNIRGSDCLARTNVEGIRRVDTYALTRQVSARRPAGGAVGRRAAK